MARVVFATREVWPFLPGAGIGRYVWTAAGALAADHEVTVVTSSRHGPTRERLPDGVRLVVVDEPDGGTAPHVGWADDWSARLQRAVADLRPDVVEFPDYLGEGFATVHARRAGDAALRATTVVVRMQGAAEMVAALNSAPAVAADGLVWGMERFALRHADALLWPGGDVLERARAFYGELPRDVRLPLPLAVEPVAAHAPPEDGPLRILYLNRLMPLKGAAELVAALRLRPDRDVRLTIVGGDTDLAPGGGSMRAHLARLAAGDARVGFADLVPHEAVGRLIAAHHVVAVPSRWETFSYVVREALAAGRPVLAAGVGPIPDVVVPGRSGWLAESGTPEDLARALDTIDVSAARALIDRGVAGVLDDERTAAAGAPAVYTALAGAAAAPTPPTATPRVRAVLSVIDTDEWSPSQQAALARTREALAEQVGVRLTVVERRSPEDRVPAYRDGAGGDEPLVALVPGTSDLVPDALARLAAALEDPRFDYATAITAGGDLPYYAPLGGTTSLLSGHDAGASVAVVRRAALDRALATAVEERDLWDGLEGVVSQEPLVPALALRPMVAAPALRGGRFDAAAAAAAFGPIWHSAAAMDVPVEAPGGSQLDRFVDALCGDGPRTELPAAEAAEALLRGTPDGVVVIRDGLPPGDEATALVAELVRVARPVLLVLPNHLRLPEAPGAVGLDAARAALAGLRGAVWLSQHLAEGSVLVPGAAGEGEPAALTGEVVGADAAEPAYAERWLVCAGFDDAQLARARATVALVAAPLHVRELQGLRAANADLERHNRQLASGLLGRHDAAAVAAIAKLEARTKDAENRAWILEQEKLQAEARHAQLQAWTDAGRYHAVDRAIALARRAPGAVPAARAARGALRRLRPRG